MDARPRTGPWMEAGREAGLVQAAQRGELAALCELLHHHQRPLWRLCFALTRRHDEAEALMQETARRSYRNLRQLKSGQTFFPWLARIARALALTQSRRRAGEPVSAPLTRPNGQAWEAGVLGARDVGYEQRVLAAFAELAVEEQTLLALRLFERLPYADVAAIAEIPLTAAMHRIAAVRERIELAMRGEDRAA